MNVMWKSKLSVVTDVDALLIFCLVLSRLLALLLEQDGPEALSRNLAVLRRIQRLLVQLDFDCLLLQLVLLVFLNAHSVHLLVPFFKLGGGLLTRLARLGLRRFLLFNHGLLEKVYRRF